MDKTKDRYEKAEEAYYRRFGIPAPQPHPANQDRITDELERAIQRGKPIPPDFDWWAKLPPGADA